MMDSKYLFRGVSQRQFRGPDKGLSPKAVGDFKYVFSSDEIVDQDTERVIRSGEGMVSGSSEVNAVLRHQIDPKAEFPTSGISTTPYRTRAEFYATHGYSGQVGHVLVIARDLLKPHGVREFVVSEIVPKPSLPEDAEVILVAVDGGVLPQEIISDVMDV